jgi:hypothetical protein
MALKIGLLLSKKCFVHVDVLFTDFKYMESFETIKESAFLSYRNYLHGIIYVTV